MNPCRLKVNMQVKLVIWKPKCILVLMTRRFEYRNKEVGAIIYRHGVYAPFFKSYTKEMHAVH